MLNRDTNGSGADAASAAAGGGTTPRNPTPRVPNTIVKKNVEVQVMDFEKLRVLEALNDTEDMNEMLQRELDDTNHASERSRSELELRLIGQATDHETEVNTLSKQLKLLQFRFNKSHQQIAELEGFRSRSAET